MLPAHGTKGEFPRPETYPFERRRPEADLTALGMPTKSKSVLVFGAWNRDEQTERMRAVAAFLRGEILRLTSVPSMERQAGKPFLWNEGWICGRLAILV